MSSRCSLVSQIGQFDFASLRRRRNGEGSIAVSSGKNTIALKWKLLLGICGFGWEKGVIFVSVKVGCEFSFAF